MKKIEECAIIKKLESKFNMVFKTRVSRIVSSSIIFFCFGVIFMSSCLGILHSIDSHKGVGGLETSAVPVAVDDDFKALSGLLEESKDPEPAVEIALEKGESLSKPYAVWAQTAERLSNYGDPWKLPDTFDDPRAGAIDIHTEANWLEALRIAQGPIAGW